MPTPRLRSTSTSPDPLSTPLEENGIITATPSRPRPSPSTKIRSMPKAGPSTPTPRKSSKPLVQLTSGRKRSHVEDAAEKQVGDGRKSRMPLAKRSPAPNEHVGEKASNGMEIEMAPPRSSVKRSRGSISRKGKEKAEEEEVQLDPTPSKSKTARNSTTTPARSTTRKSLGSSIKALPTPSPASRTMQANPPPSHMDAMRSFNEAFDPDSMVDETDTFGTLAATPAKAGASISREVFLANEALRRQREARNFLYEGDENAPRLTRSGRVVGRDRGRGAEVGDAESQKGLEVDEYGVVEPGSIGEADAGDLSVDPVTAPDAVPSQPFFKNGSLPGTPTKHVSTKSVAEAVPLPPHSQGYIMQMMAILTGQEISWNPPSFTNEDKNETLQGLVNLLKGTVERGEGNSAMVVGPRGSGKTRTMARALQLLPSTSKTAPIIVRLSGHAQTNDRLAIREMGRQIAEAEGKKVVDDTEEQDEGEEQEEYAPTTLPSHLLALLTAPSPRAIVIVIEEFDLFTEHARQALLYCLLDVVQSVKTGPVETTGRGVAVIGLTTRIDTLLLLEKRVKSRFSHRVWRVTSPLSPDGPGWVVLLRSALLPWAREKEKEKEIGAVNGSRSENVKDKGRYEEERWKQDWEWAIDSLLGDDKVKRYLDRLTGLTTDVRNLYRPFILPLAQIASGRPNFLSVPTLTSSIMDQIEHSGLGLATIKLKGLSQPCLAILVISKHLCYAGREEFNFAQVEEEYLRFARTRLVGSGRVRWPVGVLRVAYEQMLHLGLLVPTGPSSLKPHFARVRCTLSPHEIVAWFKGEGANLLGTELGNWGRMMGGHA